MRCSRVIRVNLALLAGVLLLPALALAQTGAIGGSVTDETGGVLPGVTVEATSPALIEGVRTTVTDGAGLYTIEALRPGTYTVTFTLPGFNTFVREGIELVTDFTANVDGTMTVGSIEETVTVSGASPVIDVQNVVSQENLSREEIDTLPTSRTYFGLAALTPGMTGSIAGGGHDVGGATGDIWGYVRIHGSSDADGMVMWDGMSINNNIGLGGGSSKEFFLNQAAIQEMVVSTSDMNAEHPFGGVATNAIPREGANTFNYYVNVNGTSGDLQADNVDEALQARGASPLAKSKKIWDYGVGVGGPLVQDRVWFYTAHRWWGAQNFTPLGNTNIAPGYQFEGALNPQVGHGPTYIADPNDPHFTDFYNQDNSIRFTIQASERNKITLSQALQDNCACGYWPQWGIVDTAGSQDYTYSPINLTQASWTFPASNRLLFEAGFSYLLNNSAPESHEGVWEDAEALAATGMTFEQFMAADPLFALQYVDVPHMSYSPVFNWRSHGIRTCAPCLLGTGHDFPTQVFRGSVSYVTGSHNLKIGVDGRWAAEEHAESRVASNAWPIRLDFFTRDPATGALGGGPGGIYLVNQLATPRASFMNSFEFGFFAQDQWTIDRLTLNLGVRYDRLNGWVPSQTAPTGRWGFKNPDGTPFTVDRIDNVPNYHDIVPRIGVAYDLSGDGRTAIKATVGKYVVPIGTHIAQDVNPLEGQVQTARAWLDFNGNFIPDCDLDNFFAAFGANGECGPIFNPAFGNPAAARTYDPGVREGWGVRQNQWQNSVSIQQELTNVWSIEVGYYRTQYGNFRVVDNENIGPEDFIEYSILAPAGSEVIGLTPGQRIEGLYTISAAGQAKGISDVVKRASDFGDMHQVFHGIDVNFDGRFDNGIRLGGGFSTGGTTYNECFVVDNPMRNRDGFCEVSEPWSAGTQFKLNGSVPLPYDTEFSFVLQSLAGQPWVTEYRSGAAADMVQIVGQDCPAGCVLPNGSETILLTPSGQGVGSISTIENARNRTSYTPGTNGFYFRAADFYEPRLNQLDVRFTKIFNVGGGRIRGWVDLFNIFNANSAAAVSDQFVSQGYPFVTAVMGGRLLKFGAQFDF